MLAPRLALVSLLVSTALAQAPIQVSINPKHGLPAKELLKLTQVMSGDVILYDRRLIQGKKVFLAGTAAVPREDFLTFAKAALYRLDLECIEDRGKNANVWRLVPRTNRTRIAPAQEAAYLHREQPGYDVQSLVLTAVTVADGRAQAFVDAVRKSTPESVSMAALLDGTTVVLQGPGRDVLRGKRALRQLPVPQQKSKLERVATGFRFVEGPAWNPRDDELLFSDIPDQRILRVDKRDRVFTYLHPSGRANGLMFDAEGNLYACQGGARQLIRIAPNGERQVLASHFDGKRLNSPNDLALDNAGGVYFTDPRYGRMDNLEQKVMGVYYVAADGEVTRVIDSLRRPNGIVVTQDGRTMYVAEPDKREIWVYGIQAPGKLTEGRRLFQSDRELDGGGPDGMALDVQGRLYATYKNLLVLTPEGQIARRIPVPEKPANCTFGGEDNKTLYITARTSLYRLRTDVAGQPLQSTR